MHLGYCILFALLFFHMILNSNSNPVQDSRKRYDEGEDSMMARRTREPVGPPVRPAWATTGGRGTPSLAACGPVSVAVGRVGLCGPSLSSALRHFTWPRCPSWGGFLWCHVGPRCADTQTPVRAYGRMPWILLPWLVVPSHSHVMKTFKSTRKETNACFTIFTGCPPFHKSPHTVLVPFQPSYI